MHLHPATRLGLNLTQPLDFLNVTSPRNNLGYYLFGYEDFRVADMPVVGILQRSILGRYEDFVLGVISVLLIALLSEIVQTILMRTHENRLSRRGLHVASVLDEVHHFRNMWRLVRRHPSCQKNTFHRSVANNSVIIVFIACMLLAAEVFAVYLTQPVRVYSSPQQYNVKGMQPAGTTMEMAVHIDEITKKKRCMTPSMFQGSQSREFAINACIMRSYYQQFMQKDDITDFVEITSWYHEAGSDHVIEFGNSTVRGRHAMETRASITLSNGGVRKGLQFSLLDNLQQEHAQYLQMFLLDRALLWSCNTPEMDPTSCDRMRRELTVGEADFVSKHNVLLWELQDGVNVTGTVTGVMTRFQVKLKNPFEAIERSLHVFATSAVIMEKRGEGMYIDLKSGDPEVAIARLVSEEGRVAGLITLLVVLAALLVLLILLRAFLRPTSLAELARKTLDESEGNDDDYFFNLQRNVENLNGKGGRSPGLSYGPSSSGSSAVSSSSSLKKSVSSGILSKFLSKMRNEEEQVTDLPGGEDGKECQSSGTVDSV